MANKNDIPPIIRGDSHTINVNLHQDITGATVFFTVNSDSDPANDDTAAIKKTITSFTDAAAGTFTIPLAPSDTASLDEGVYWYDIQLVTASGAVSSIQKANLTLLSDITRRTA